MKEESTRTRLKQIMDERGLKQADIVALCRPFCKQYGVRLEKNDLSQYVNGKSKPKQDKLSILAMALNVSEAWLMGYEVSETPVLANQSSQTNDLLDDEKKLINMYRSLDTRGRQNVLRTAEYEYSLRKLDILTNETA